MKLFTELIALLTLAACPTLMAQSNHGDQGKAPQTVAPTYDAVRAYTVNQYILKREEQYSASDFAKNEHGKSQLQLIRPAKSHGLFEEYGTNLAIDGKGPIGANGKPLFLHYNSPWSERDGRDTWAEPQTICSTIVFAAEWKKKCNAKLKESYPNMGPNQRDEACTLQIGDLSLPHKKRNENGRCDLGHKSHYKGTCVDVRPVSPKGLTKGKIYKTTDPVAVQLTQDAVNFAVSMGGNKPIWQSSGHYDHFHVCFPPGSTPNSTLLEGKVGKGPLKGCYGLR